MPYTPVSYGTGHSFRGTSIERECFLVLCVWTEPRVVVMRVKWNERMKEFEGGRRPTTGRSGTNGEMHRQISLESEQMLRNEPSIRSVSKGKNDYSVPLNDSSRRSPFCGGIR